MRKTDKMYLETVITEGLFNHPLPDVSSIAQSEMAIRILRDNKAFTDKGIADICVDIYKKTDRENVKQNILHVLGMLKGIDNMVYKELWTSFYDETNLNIVDSISKCVENWDNTMFISILNRFQLLPNISEYEKDWLNDVKEEIEENFKSRS